MNTKTTNIVQSVDRALKIIDIFHNLKKDLGVTEVAENLGLHKSTTFGLMCTLEKRGYLIQNNETGKYRLGFKFMEIGNDIHENMNMIQVIRPYLKELSDKYEETVHYAVEENNQVVYIDKIESPRALVIKSSIGKRNPMHCTGVGKCILSFISDEKREAVLCGELERYTDNTITDRSELEEELKIIRTNGYSIDNEEIEEGLRCIAAPVFNVKGELMGGLSISGPSTRMSDKRITELLGPLLKTTAQISRSLGYRM